MNLIEQLGGYEKAKAFLNATSFTIDELIMMQRSGLRTQHVEKALLEYRRQHNIYEAGDPVVSRCADKETRIFTYQETIGKNILVKCKKGRGYCYPKKWFSHATDSEIEVGKRLGVGCE